MKLRLVLVAVATLASLLSMVPTSSYAAPAAAKKVKKAPRAEDITDWSQTAADELEKARSETAKPDTKSAKAARATNRTGDTNTAKPVTETAPADLTDALRSGVLPTPATIRAEVTGVRSAIERSALRFTFLFEPYQPKGLGAFGTGQLVDYSALPGSVLGQVDLRWLPYDIGSLGSRPLSLGGYAAFGYSRQALPLVAESGFRYEDSALNTLRIEAGLAWGLELNDYWNLEARTGVGRLSYIQTSRYSDVAGTFERSYLVGALDLSYQLYSRFALVASVASRNPIGAGSGSISFDPLTVSGGFLVQVR